MASSFLGHEDSTVTLRVYAHVWSRQKTDEAVRLAMTGRGSTAMPSGC